MSNIATVRDAATIETLKKEKAQVVVVVAFGVHPDYTSNLPVAFPNVTFVYLDLEDPAQRQVASDFGVSPAQADLVTYFKNGQHVLVNERDQSLAEFVPKLKEALKQA